MPTVEDMDDVFQSTETIKQHHSKKDLLCFGKLPQKSEIDSSLNIKVSLIIKSIENYSFKIETCILYNLIYTDKQQQNSKVLPQYRRNPTL